jgi:hypothetical protein
VVKIKFTLALQNQITWSPGINDRVSLMDCKCHLSIPFKRHSEWSQFHLLSRNIKIKIYIHVILPVVLCGCGTWSH